MRNTSERMCILRRLWMQPNWLHYERLKMQVTTVLRPIIHYTTEVS